MLRWSIEELEADWAGRIGNGEMSQLRALLKELNDAVASPGTPDRP
jgi:hypothetical protein